MLHKVLLFDPDNKKLQEQIINSKNPAEIKRLGRLAKNFNEETWDTHKYNIMLDGLKLKFTQNENLKKLPLDTKEAILVEASPKDTVWGIGLDAITAVKLNNPAKWLGQSLLGKGLVEIRKSILDNQ